MLIHNISITCLIVHAICPIDSSSVYSGHIILFDVSPAHFGKGRWRCDLHSNETGWKAVCEVWDIALSQI